MNLTVWWCLLVFARKVRSYCKKEAGKLYFQTKNNHFWLKNSQRRRI